MKTKRIKKLLYLSLLMVAVSCSKNPVGWSIVGEIKGEGDYSLALEGFNNGKWYVIDSLRTSEGGFSYHSDAPAAYPEILRIGLEGQYIYFPIDSVDQVKIFAQADNFANGYNLDGTLQARTIKSLDSLINVSVAEKGTIATLNDASFKQELFVKAFDDPSVMPLFYLINKSVGESPLFEPSNPSDLRLFGAVAQRFSTVSPEDPRGHLLSAIYRQARNSMRNEIATIEVPETSLIDIVRYDEKGDKQSLADLASKGDLVLLSFTAYGLENSPSYNLILNNVYEKYHDKGLQIYQIGFDGDEAAWKESAVNLPWTTVWNSTTDGDIVLANYNVGAIPTTFIIDRSGTVVERVSDPTELESRVSRYF